ncbi:hypothetical protein, partial [Klebsiella pneumoniae]|uniref:hypothetical protein n=1 Tax=Klebsiella pneumoniae TaxID=573 RepID=UPI003EE13CD6
CARASIDYTLGDVNLKMIRAEEDLKALVAKHPDFPEAGLLGIMSQVMSNSDWGIYFSLYPIVGIKTFVQNIEYFHQITHLPAA